LSRVLLCTGVHAQTPYFIQSLGMRVWSVEELCYCLCESAYLLNEDIVEKGLVDWIEEECQLPQLSGILRPYTKQPGSMMTFVVSILGYVGYYSEDEIVSISKTLTSGGDTNDFDKKKKRADYLVENKRFLKALVEYERLLRELPENEIIVRADVLHNIGVSLAGLFMFEEAAQYFKEAHNFTNNPDDYRDYLAARRLSMSDSEYVKFIADEPDSYMASINLETDVDDILSEWESSDELSEVDELIDLKNRGDSNMYYKEINRMVENLKEEYREFIQL